MTLTLRKMLVVGVGVGLLGIPTHALFGEKAEGDAKKADAKKTEVVIEDDAADAAGAADKDNLWPVTRLDQAFLKVQRSRNYWAQFHNQKNSLLQQSTDEKEKAKLQEEVNNAKRNFTNVDNAMRIVFSLGNRRAYTYNPVTSTIYLEVGRVDTTFTRGVRTLNSLRNLVREQNALKEAEKDEKKKGEIDARIQNATRQYNVVAASMQLIFGYVQTRNYQYNPANSTLYLKISDTELEKLQQQLAAQQQTAQPAKEKAPKKK